MRGVTGVCSLEHSIVTKDTGGAGIGEILSAKLSVSCFPNSYRRAFEDSVFPTQPCKKGESFMHDLEKGIPESR